MNTSNMAAEFFEDIIKCIRTSNLNFHLQLSPYSAIISLKKSFIKDKAGSPIPPPLYKQQNANYDTILKRNQALEEEINILSKAYKKSLNDLAALEDKVKILENNEDKIKSDLTQELSSQYKCKDISIKELKLKVSSLHTTNEKLVSTTDDLNKKVSEMEKAANDFTSEIISSKK